MTDHLSDRRSFMTGLGAAAAVAGLGTASAAAQTPSAPFVPARHVEDNWMDALPGKHRMVVDGVTANGAGEAILFASNLYSANRSGYKLAEQDLAVIVVLRHFATPFAFADAVWAQYGKAMGAILKFTDPKSGQAPDANLYNKTGYGLTLTNLGSTIDAQVKRGTQFAICDQAMHFTASQVAAAGGGQADAIYKTFAANLIPNSRIVPAGVVAVNRAQERGYTLIYAG